MREIPETGLRPCLLEDEPERLVQVVRMREIPETGLRLVHDGDEGFGEGIVRMREIPETGLRLRVNCRSCRGLLSSE